MGRAGGGLCLGEWRTVLWYQGRSRVVPEWYQGGKGVQSALLTIANTYTSQRQTTPLQPPRDLQATPISKPGEVDWVETAWDKTAVIVRH